MAGIKNSPTCIGTTVIVGFLVIFFGVWAGEEAFHQNNKPAAMDGQQSTGKFTYGEGTRIARAMKDVFTMADYTYLNKEDGCAKVPADKVNEMNNMLKAADAATCAQIFPLYESLYRSCKHPKCYNGHYSAGIAEIGTCQFGFDLGIDEAGYKASKATFMKNCQRIIATKGRKISPLTDMEIYKTKMDFSKLKISPKPKPVTKAQRRMMQASVDWSSNTNRLGFPTISTEVYNQNHGNAEHRQGCNACYAIATAEVFGAKIAADKGATNRERAYGVAYNPIIACATDTKYRGCHNEASLDVGFTFVQDLGLPTRSAWYGAGGDKPNNDIASEYTLKSGSCVKFSPVVTGKGKSFYNPNDPADADTLLELLQNGPVAIAIASGENANQIQNYDGGAPLTVSKNQITTGKAGLEQGGVTLDHAVVLVGYGTQDGIDYWKIKNSWGQAAGDKGFFKVERNVHAMGIGYNHGYVETAEYSTAGVTPVGGAFANSSSAVRVSYFLTVSSALLAALVSVLAAQI